MGTEKKAAAEVQENQTEQAAAQVQAPVAYCGPTIKGIAPQYTVFVDGLPDKLKEKVEQVPLLKALIVPLATRPRMIICSPPSCSVECAAR